MGNCREKAETVQPACGWDYHDTCSLPILQLKTLMPASQAVLMDHMNFHSASSQETSFNSLSVEFQLCQRLPLPTASFCKDYRYAILNIQHICSSWYVWKKCIRSCTHLQVLHKSCSHGNKNKNITRRFRLVKPTRANSVFLYIGLYFISKKGHRQYLG